MTLLKRIKRIIKGQNKLIDIWHYFVGNYRYKLYYKEYNYLTHTVGRHDLMRQHIWEQIKYRIEVMDKECYNNGQCKICECETTQLQMANKRCDGICYPTMMNKENWERYKAGGTFTDIGGVWIKRKDALRANLPSPYHIFYKETINGYVPHQRD